MAEGHMDLMDYECRFTVNTNRIKTSKYIAQRPYDLRVPF